MNTHNTPPLAVRGTAEVCRELGVPAWFVERLLSAEGYRVQRLGNARAWTEEDVAWLRGRLALRAARRGGGGRAPEPSTTSSDPADLAVDLAAELDREAERAVRS